MISRNRAGLLQPCPVYRYEQKGRKLGESFSHRGKYVRLIGIGSRWFWGGLVAAMGLRSAIAAVDGARWKYVRDIVSVHIATETYWSKPCPIAGEVDRGVLPKCNGRRVVRRRISSKRVRFLVDV